MLLIYLIGMVTTLLLVVGGQRLGWDKDRPLWVSGLYAIMWWIMVPLLVLSLFSYDKENPTNL